ncbi:MAG: YchJ family metal-binding protein [Dethiobacteria bacterium]|jgi:uncharacterized protein YchJ|nr:YchJ family metal-binding protein [Bacillota bacterium]NMD32683.1 DUF4878 domain-containing protein [Bacillota bacterium]HOB28798.1 YchJ family metal-binding protein [Bacillota bacterium]HPZ42164.1 YchJ family metal-binding protein [Bacillota bacterium]HQD53100.1 YchJ family metal-binding protein [Bacillota bacterium]
MKQRLFLIANLFLVVFLGGCSTWGQGVQSSPATLMEAYLTAFQQKDLETMLQLSDNLEASEEELAFLKKFIEMIELESYRIDNVELLSGDEALVEVTVTLLLMGQQRTQTERIRVIRKEGKWYLREGIR